MILELLICWFYFKRPLKRDIGLGQLFHCELLRLLRRSEYRRRCHFPRHRQVHCLCHTAHHLLELRGASDTLGWAKVTSCSCSSCSSTIGRTAGWYCAGGSRWIVSFGLAESAGRYIFKGKVAVLNFVVPCLTVLCRTHLPCWTAHSLMICSRVELSALFCQDAKVWKCLSVELNCLKLDSRMLGEWNNRLLSLWSFWCFRKQCFPVYGSS